MPKTKTAFFDNFSPLNRQPPPPTPFPTTSGCSIQGLHWSAHAGNIFPALLTLRRAACHATNHPPISVHLMLHSSPLAFSLCSTTCMPLRSSSFHITKAAAHLLQCGVKRRPIVLLAPRTHERPSSRAACLPAVPVGMDMVVYVSYPADPKTPERRKKVQNVTPNTLKFRFCAWALVIKSVLKMSSKSCDPSTLTDSHRDILSPPPCARALPPTRRTLARRRGASDCNKFCMARRPRCAF